MTLWIVMAEFLWEMGRERSSCLSISKYSRRPL
jgi:hypothetical protein